MPKILVIDDEAPFRNLIRTILEQSGDTVIEAEDGRQGLTLFNNHQPDLVICDIFMPVMEGIETITKLKSESPQCPILAISGGGSGRDFDFLKMAKKIGADGVIQKPISHDSFIIAVRELLN